MYTVYYIPSKNYVGCTNNLKRRLNPNWWGHDVPIEEVEILFQSDNILLASHREQEYQQQLLGKADGQYYHQQTTPEINRIRNRAIAEKYKGIPLSEEHKCHLSKIRLGRIWVNNGQSEAFIEADKFQEYSAKGYAKGRLPFSQEARAKMGNSQRGKIWVSNDHQEVNIDPDQLPEYEKKGYLVGRLPFSEERKKKMGKPAQGKIWVNNGQRHTVIYPEHLEKYKADGYQKGMLRMKTDG